MTTKDYSSFKQLPLVALYILSILLIALQLKNFI